MNFPAEGVFGLVPLLGFLYWLGGRSFGSGKWVRRVLGWLALVVAVLAFLPKERFTSLISTIFYLLAAVLGYGESSKLVKLVKNRVLAFGIVGGVHAIGPAVLSSEELLRIGVLAILPVLFMVSGWLSLKNDAFEWAWVEMLWGLSIGAAWSWAIRMNLSG